MAILVDTRWIAESAAGVRLSGAKLYIYEQGTGILADVFSDVDKTVPLANPVVADINGVFPLIYGTENVYVDADLKTSGDVDVRSYTDVPLLSAENTSVFLRDMGINGRAQMRGDSGVIQLEFGNESGDDIGGSARIGGWSGTPLDDLEIDATAITVTGDETIQGGLQVDGSITTSDGLLDLVTANAAASGTTIDIALPDDTNAWELDLINWSIPDLSGGVTITARLSFDGGATYEAGATSYVYVVVASAAATTTTQAAAPQIALHSWTSWGSNTGHLNIRIYSGEAVDTGVFWSGGVGGTGGASSVSAVRGYAHTAGKSFTKATHIRLLSTVAVTFTYALRSLRGS